MKGANRFLLCDGEEQRRSEEWQKLRTDQISLQEKAVWRFVRRRGGPACEEKETEEERGRDDKEKQSK